MTLLAVRKSWRAGLVGAAVAAVLSIGPLLASPAYADPPGDPKQVSDVTEYRFEDEDVFGRDREPLGEVLLTRRRAERTSLVRAREHFVRELLQSVEAL